MKRQQHFTRAQLASAIAAQLRWINEHGGSEAAYVDRYGVPGVPGCYGNGGVAIWRADLSELVRLEVQQ